MGTYSGYAEFFAGYAVTVEINVGACSDPEHELEELRAQQQDMASALQGVGEAVGRAVEHYQSGDHRWKHYAPLLDPSPRDYAGPAPEAMWSSEARSRGAKLPLSLFKEPEPPSDDLVLRAPTLRPEAPIVVNLYLASERVPYLVREVIDGHLVASLFSPGGACADAFTDASLADRAHVESVLRDAHQGVNRSTLYRVLRTAAENRAWIDAIAEGSDEAGLMARVVRVFLDPAQFTVELANEARSRRQAMTLMAIVTTDAHWTEHGATLRSLDGAFEE